MTPWRFWRSLLFKTGAAIGGILLVVMLVFGLPDTIRGTGIVDTAGNRRGPDFLTHYTAGAMVLRGDAAHLYDPTIQAAAQEAALGTTLDRPSPFLLPPAAALIFAPLARLPYSAAAAVWVAITVGLMAVTLRLVWPLSALRGRVPAVFAMLALVGTYPVGMNLIGGNNAALWLLIYALGTRYLLNGQQVAAGIVLGFGALKPQLFLAVPVFLLVQRRWRTLLAAATVASLLAILSVLMVGLDGVRAYLDFLTSDAYRAEVALPNAWRMLSLPAFVRGFWPNAPNLTVLLIIGAGLVLLALAVRRAPLPVAVAAAVLVSVAIDPHCFLYDGLVLAVPILLRAGGAGWGAPWWALAALWLGTWLIPFRDQPPPGSIGGIPWVVLPLLVLVAAALRDAAAATVVRAGQAGGHLVSQDVGQTCPVIRNQNIARVSPSRSTTGRAVLGSWIPYPANFARLDSGVAPGFRGVFRADHENTVKLSRFCIAGFIKLATLPRTPGTICSGFW